MMRPAPGWAPRRSHWRRRWETIPPARAGEGDRTYREVRTPSPQPSPQRGEGARRVRGAAVPYDRRSISVRIDTGVEEGSEISIYYDPLIAKLITHAPWRQEAVAAQ